MVEHDKGKQLKENYYSKNKSEKKEAYCREGLGEDKKEEILQKGVH